MKEIDGFIVKNGVKMRRGYTTGSCAAAAATAAALMLFTKSAVKETVITLPGGAKAAFAVDDINIGQGRASCSVIKDAGDDPDVTNGAKIIAECALGGDDIIVKGGPGVGVVTAKGLRCPPGDAAINPQPRAMIIKNVKDLCHKFSYEKGLIITISVPDGDKIAKNTFNPRLGITGGISILGTTGVVEPMSESALIDTIKLLIDQRQDEEKILVSPGSYGREYCQRALGLDIREAVKCSNFIGETLDYLVYKQFKQLLIVGHIGKLVKIAAGVMNTHSRAADARMEVFAAHSALMGGDRHLVKDIMDSPTTDRAIELLEARGLREAVLDSIMEKILFHIDYRTKNSLKTGVAAFSAQNLYLSRGAKELIALFKE